MFKFSIEQMKAAVQYRGRMVVVADSRYGVGVDIIFSRPGAWRRMQSRAA